MSSTSPPKRAQTTTPPSRQRGIWTLIAQGLLLLGVFVFGLGLAVVLHANTTPVRAVVGQALNRLVADTFYGSVRLDAVTHISLSAVRVSRVTVRDEYGERVLVLNDVRLELDVVDNLRRYIKADDSWILHFPHARVEKARVLLVTDEHSEAPTLSRALTPKPRPPRADSPDTPARQLRVWFPTIELGRVTGSLQLASLEGLEPRLVAVRGSLLVSPKGVAVDVSRFGVAVLGLDVRVRGTGTVRLRAPGPLEVQFAGFAANSEVQASVKLVRNQLTASVSSPRLTSTTMRRLWPAWPIDAPLTLSAKAAGQLPKLELELLLQTASPVSGSGPAASLEPMTLTSRGSLELTPNLSAQVQTQIEHLSLSLFDPTYPVSDIAATIDTSLRLDDSLQLEASAQVPATQIADVPLPPIVARVTTNGERVNAEVSVQEPGAKTSVTVVYGISTGALEASFAIPSVSLTNQRRLPDGLRGQGSLTGKLTLRDSALGVDARGEVNNLRIGPLSLGHAKLEANSDADSDHLEQGHAHFSVQASQVALGAVRFAQADASGTLSTERASVKLSLSDPDGRKLTASGNYHFGSGEVTAVQLQAERGSLVGKAKVTRFDPSLPALDVEQLEITSTACAPDTPCPRLRGFGRYRPGLLQGELHARSVLLEQLGPIFGVNLPLSGQIDLDAELAIGRHSQQATLSLQADRFSVLNYNHSQVQVNASLQDSQLTGKFTALDALGIGAEGSWDVELRGDPLSGSTWQRATGTAELGVSEVSLQALPWLLNQPWLSRVNGDAALRMTLQRSEPKGLPTVFAQLGIAALEADFQTSPDSAPIELPESALYVSSTFNPEQNVLYASASLRDNVGTLLTATGSMPLVPQAWFEPDAPRADIKRSPISLNLNLPQRSLRAVPGLRENPLTGEVGAQVVVYGTVGAPQVSAFVSLNDLLVPGLRDNTPVSLQTSAHYARATGDFSLELVGSSLGKSVALGKADGVITWPPEPDSRPFQGDVRLALDGLPLSLFAPLSELELAGEATGLLEIDQSRHRSINVLLDFEDVSSGRAAIGSGTLRATGQAGLLKSELVLTREDQELMFTLDAFAATDGLPFPHQINRVNALLRMRQMNAAAFSPLLSAVVARLTGVLDTNVTFEWERDLSAEEPDWRSSISGIAHLREARAYVDGLGLELQDVSVDAVATPLGRETHLLLERVRAKARSDDVNFEARGELMFSGARLSSGQANAVLRQVPLTLQGLNLGRATGSVSAQLERRENWDRPGPHRGKPYLLVTAMLSDWSMRASASASRSLIDTSANSEIRVLQGVTATEAEDGMPYRVYLQLGRNVRFSLADLDLPLSGRVQLDYANETSLYGTIELERGGRVPIFGRVFEVEDGSLRLNPAQPSNPNIDISLSGQSRDGTPVYVSLSGTLKEPLVSPPLAQLQELLGGGTATALSGGAQALGLTSLLGDNIQLRVGSDENEQELARYSAAVQIRENLWLEVNYQRNDTSSFSQQESDAVSGTLDYRFNDAWSLRTEAGTTGGSVDVVWQYRY